MISLSRFSLFRKGEELIVISLEDRPCPICGGKLVVHGTCKRKLKDLSGETKTLRLRVMECTQCGKTHRELIEGIAPYRRYDIDLICAIYETSDTGVAESCFVAEGNTDASSTESLETHDTYICDESVRNRVVSWVSWLLAYIKKLGLCQSQRQSYQQHFSLASHIKEGVREIVNSGRWKIQHQFVVQLL